MKNNNIILAFFILIIFVLFSCKTENIMPEEETIEQLEWKTGKNEYNMEMDDTLRNFLVHVPASYTGDSKTPLVFMLHGTSGTGTKFYNISGWVQKSEEVGCIVVFPTALEYPIVENNNKMTTKWSKDGLESDIPAGYPIKDDIPFFKQMIDILEKTFNIDEKRIYITGFSNGGAFVRTRILDEMNDVFAACSTGGIGLEKKLDIQGRIPPFYQIIGTKDPKWLEALGINNIPHSYEKIVKIEQLKTRIDNMKQSLKLGDDYTEELTDTKYNLITWNNDLNGSGNEAKLLIVNQLLHRYPNGKNNPKGVSASEILWDWFIQYELN